MYMNIITSTQLRTQIPEVIATLLAGGSIDFIHRSKIVGEFKPKVAYTKTISANQLKRKINALNLPQLTEKEIDRRYRAAMMKKHG